MSFSVRWPENLPSESLAFSPSLAHQDIRRRSADVLSQSPSRVRSNSDPLFADLTKTLDHNVLVSALEGLLNNQRTSDVEIVVDGHTVFAHSPILASRSPYFRTMFDSGFRESIQAQSNGGTIRIEITDFPFDVIYAFVTYIYTNRMVTTVAAKDIFLVADKYEVLPLRDLAEKAITDTLSVDRVCEQLFAYGHRFPTLRSKMIHFIATHFQQIDQKCDLVDLIQEFKHQMEEGDQILVEIMRAMSKSVYSPSPNSRFSTGFVVSPSSQTPLSISNPAGGFQFFGSPRETFGSPRELFVSPRETRAA